MALSEIEIDTLRSLLMLGQQPLFASAHLLRLERLGLVRNGGPSGHFLSAAGRLAALRAQRSVPAGAAFP